MISSWALPVRAGAIVSLSTCAVITAASLAGVAVSTRLGGDSFWPAAGALGRTVVVDAAWLLPLLFGAVVAILALLLGQSLTRTVIDDDADTQRRRLAAACLLLAGAAMAVLLVATVGAVECRDIVPRLWSVAIAVVLVVGSALWLATVVFGPPEQQFRILGHTLADLAAQRSRVPSRNGRQAPVLRFVAACVSVVVIATVLAVLGFAATAEASEPVAAAPPTLLGAGAVVALLVALVGLAFTLVTVYLDDSSTRPALARATAVCHAAVSLGWPAFAWAFGAAGNVDQAVVVLCLTAYLTPAVLAVVVPRGSRSVLSLRAAVDGVRLRTLRRRSIRVRASRVALTRAIELVSGSTSF